MNICLFLGLERHKICSNEHSAAVFSNFERVFLNLQFCAFFYLSSLRKHASTILVLFQVVWCSRN
jgi:hypothetical protein